MGKEDMLATTDDTHGCMCHEEGKRTHKNETFDVRAHLMHTPPSFSVTFFKTGFNAASCIMCDTHCHTLSKLRGLYVDAEETIGWGRVGRA